MADIDMIRLAASRTGLGMKFVSKDLRISDMLSQLGELSGKKMVILKGGTALNRLYIKKRFSEDIDMDFIPASPGGANKRVVSGIMKKVEGFEIERPRMMGDVARYDCYYENEFGEKDKIRAEFNFHHGKTVSAEAPKGTTVESFILPYKSSSISVYSFEDLIAQKISALLGREDGKDIFDLFHSLEMGYRKNVLRKALLVLGIGDSEYLKRKTCERLELFKEKSSLIGNAANHYIPVSLRPEWRGFIDTLVYKIERI